MAYPSVNHSPWNNITFADFVMPWFLFMVGTSMAFSMRRYQGSKEAKIAGTKMAVKRALKLYWLGVLLQGGGWIGDPGEYQFGYNILTLRWCGILNRIAYAYLIVALMEIWFPVTAGAFDAASESVHPPAKFADYCRNHTKVFTRYGLHWAVAIISVLLHLVLTFATFVPSYVSEWGWGGSDGSPSVLLDANHTFVIKCDVRGAIGTPECSAAGFYDRALFGQVRGNRGGRDASLCAVLCVCVCVYSSCVRDATASLFGQVRKSLTVYL